MAFTEYKERKKRKRRPKGPIVAAFVLIVLIAGALVYYDTRGVYSTTVYCFVGEYILYPAETVIGQSTSNVTETLTTAVSYTSSTSVAGHVGSTTANSTSTLNLQGDPEGVETICKYVSNTSSSSASSSFSSSSK